MFGHKAQTPFNTWLGLSHYNCSESILKDSLVQQQFALVWAVNKWALKGIQQSMQMSTERLCQKSLQILEGNLVLLHDHLECHNKIQDRYKSEEFVVVGRYPEPNLYHIKQLYGNGPVWTVNQCQLQDLGKTKND